MPHYFIKLNPPRNTFPADITPEEMAVMQRHANYWKGFSDKGMLVVYGPVYNPDGGAFGMGVMEVEKEEQVKDFIANDPVALAKLGTLEYYPMKAIVPEKK
jgi:uncharacterized protein